MNNPEKNQYPTESTDTSKEEIHSVLGTQEDVDSLNSALRQIVKNKGGCPGYVEAINKLSKQEEGSGAKKERIILVSDMCKDLDPMFRTIGDNLDDSDIKLKISSILDRDWTTRVGTDVSSEEQELVLENQKVLSGLMHHFKDDITRAVAADVFGNLPEDSNLKKEDILSILDTKVALERAKMDLQVLKESIENSTQWKTCSESIRTVLMEFYTGSLEFDPSPTFEVDYDTETNDVVLIPHNPAADDFCKKGGGENGPMDRLRKIISTFDKGGKRLGDIRVIFSIGEIVKEAECRMDDLARKSVLSGDIEEQLVEAEENVFKAQEDLEQKKRILISK